MLRAADALAMYHVLSAIFFHFSQLSEIQLVCDRPTDGPTDRPTDGRTDGHTLL